VRCGQVVDVDVKKFVRHPDIVVLLHPFGMSNFSVNFLYSVGRRVETERKTEEGNKRLEKEKLIKEKQ
jgi:hypothetical protein